MSLSSAPESMKSMAMHKKNIHTNELSRHLHYCLLLGQLYILNYLIYKSRSTKFVTSRIQILTHLAMLIHTQSYSIKKDCIIMCHVFNSPLDCVKFQKSIKIVILVEQLTYK